MKDFVPIESKMLKGARYDAETKRLHVQFKNGSIYESSKDVPKDVYESFAKTFQTKDSSGRHFNAHIKKYDLKKIA